MKSRVIVRNLPPDMKIDQLKGVLDDWGGGYDYLELKRRCFITEGPNFSKNSVAYLAIDEELVKSFRLWMGKSVFQDDSGKSYGVAVEFAINQSLGLESLENSMENTYKTDPTYRDFVDSLRNMEKTAYYDEIQQREKYPDSYMHSVVKYSFDESSLNQNNKALMKEIRKIEATIKTNNQVKDQKKHIEDKGMTASKIHVTRLKQTLKNKNKGPKSEKKNKK